MHCASCANLIEKSLNWIEWIKASVNYASASAKIDWNFDLKKIENEISKLWFWIEKKWEKKEDLEKIFFWKFLISLVFTLPISLTMFFEIPENFKLSLLISVCFNVFVIWFNFHKSFLQKLLKIQFNMDSLISIWTLTAIIYSIYWFHCVFIYCLNSYFKLKKFPWNFFQKFNNLIIKNICIYFKMKNYIFPVVF